MINYQITLYPKEHVYQIQLTFTPCQSQYELKLPTWIPGSYMLREFSKNIISLTAMQNKQSIKCVQVNKNTWCLSELSLATTVVVEYKVYAYDLGIRSAYLDNMRGYFNSSSLCLYVVGLEATSQHLTLHIPETWQIATSLTRLSTIEYTAANYTELIDCPVELGEFIRLEFMVKNVPHYLILSGSAGQDFDSKRLLDDMTRICTTQVDLFGGVSPCSSYTFLLYLGGEVFTGLEHANSSALMAPYFALPLQHQKQRSEDYLKLLGLISHEYFHLWNVKRIKPQVFNPYNLEVENYTKLLWWFEGITSYYDDLMLYCAGILDKHQYLQIIVDNINNVYKFGGVKQQSLVNSSLTAWIKYYRPDENSSNSNVSYYIKGGLVGMCLDLLIRQQTNGQKSLDTVLLGLYQKWQTDKLGVGEDEIPVLIKCYTECDLTLEINRFVNSCEDLPLAKLFEQFGIKLHLVPEQLYSDSGKVIKNETELPTLVKLDLGCKLVKDTLGYKVVNVYSGTVGERAALAANDVIVAINNLKLVNLEKMIGLYKAGDKLYLTVFRQERLLNLELQLASAGVEIAYLQIIDEQQLANWI